MHSFGIASPKAWYQPHINLRWRGFSTKKPRLAVRRSRGTREYQSGCCDPTPAEAPRLPDSFDLDAALELSRSPPFVRRDRRLDDADLRQGNGLVARLDAVERTIAQFRKLDELVARLALLRRPRGLAGRLARQLQGGRNGATGSTGSTG